MMLIEEADRKAEEKMKQKEKLEFIQQQADAEQKIFKEEYTKLVRGFEEDNFYKANDEKAGAVKTSHRDERNTTEWRTQ